MSPTVLGVIGPGFLNQVPTLSSRLGSGRDSFFLAGYRVLRV